MATNPRFPEEHEPPRTVETQEEWQGSRPFPWGLIAAILTILGAIALAWYFFR